MNFLKKYSLLALFSIGLLSSCGSDDDANNAQPQNVNAVDQNLQGEWQLVDFVTEGGIATGSVQGQTITVPFTQTGANYNYTAVFNTSPNTVSAEGSFSIITEASVLGQPISETVDLDSDNFNVNLLAGTWELLENGTILSATSGDITTTATIVSFSENQLVYSLDLSQDDLAPFVGGTFAVQGALVEVTAGTSTITLRR